MPHQARIKNLSTRYLRLYRYGIILIATLLFGAILYSAADSFNSEQFFFTLYFPSFWAFLIYKWIKAHAKVFQTEFDDDYLYILKRHQDIIIPLENIKDIEMKSLVGLWRVELFYADAIGDHFYFKPSLLYPLNYKSKDELVNLLWKKIEIAKTKNRYFKENSLTS